MSEHFHDELISIDAIYGPGTLRKSDDALIAILTLPSQPEISTRIKFPQDYPEQQPAVLGPDSTGSAVAKGEGQRLAQLIESVLQEIWTAGEPCVFTLIEECTARLATGLLQTSQPVLPDLQGNDANELVTSSQGTAHGAAEVDTIAVAPTWTVSEVVTEKKSVFVARTTAVSSPAEAKANVVHLLATDKKAARATHNITAWRIKGESGVQYQDCDDDGETAAGSRLLHLLELVDAWNVMVVVSRWYGGVHLGPDRFRLINQVAREALVSGGFTDQGGKKKVRK